MASSGGGNGEPEFQIAPMLDVLFVLLIFFMSISTSQMLKIDSSINLPVAANGEQPDPKTKAKAVLFNVGWDKTLGAPVVKIDDKPVNIGDEQGREAAIEEIIARASNSNKEIDPEIMVEQAAGITCGQEVYDFIMAGSEAAGAASGIMNAKDPIAMIDEMVAATRRAADDLKKQG